MNIHELTLTDLLCFVQGVQELGELVHLEVDVVVGPDEPVILGEVVRAHVLQHAEHLLLGRVDGVINI